MKVRNSNMCWRDTGYQIQEEIINKKNKWKQKNPAISIHTQKWDGQHGATIY